MSSCLTTSCFSKPQNFDHLIELGITARVNLLGSFWLHGQVVVSDQLSWKHTLKPKAVCSRLTRDTY